MKYHGPNDEYFEVVNITESNCDLLKESPASVLSLLWFVTDGNKLTIDAVGQVFDNNKITFLTEFHKVEIGQVHRLRLLRFNRPFYCILDHDSEVSCKGLLYYGASRLPVILPSDQELDILNTVWKMICIEMESKDNLQLEMLQMMLKRLLILCTRIYKNQDDFQALETDKVDLLREFNFQVEMHFREKHTVAEYAALLNRSPKTIANLFRKSSHTTPLQLIQERLMLEARRLLKYTGKTVSEIGYELGFSDVQAFSRFFRKKEGISPLAFRKIPLSGKTANV